MPVLAAALLDAARQAPTSVALAALAADAGWDLPDVAHASATVAPAGAWDAATVVLVAAVPDAACLACTRGDLPDAALAGLARVALSRLAGAEGKDDALWRYARVLRAAFGTGRLPFDHVLVTGAADGAGLPNAERTVLRGRALKPITARQAAHLEGLLAHPGLPADWRAVITQWWRAGGQNATDRLLVRIAGHPAGCAAAVDTLAAHLPRLGGSRWDVLWVAPQARALRQDPQIRHAMLDFVQRYVDDRTTDAALGALAFAADVELLDAPAFLAAVAEAAPQALAAWRVTPEGRAALAAPALAAVLAAAPAA